MKARFMAEVGMQYKGFILFWFVVLLIELSDLNVVRFE